MRSTKINVRKLLLSSQSMGKREKREKRERERERREREREEREHQRLDSIHGNFATNR